MQEAELGRWLCSAASTASVCDFRTGVANRALLDVGPRVDDDDRVAVATGPSAPAQWIRTSLLATAGIGCGHCAQATDNRAGSLKDRAPSGANWRGRCRSRAIGTRTCTHPGDDDSEIPWATTRDLHYNGPQHGDDDPSAGTGRFSLPNPALAGRGHVVKTETYRTNFDGLGFPEVVHVDYDLWELRITVRFQGHRAPIYVVFSSSNAFRVLDEGALLEYWSPEARSAGWLWKVNDGGWLGMKADNTFERGIIRGDEYIVAGVNDCVTVISTKVPKVYSRE